MSSSYRLFFCLVEFDVMSCRELGDQRDNEYLCSGVEAFEKERPWLGIRR